MSVNFILPKILGYSTEKNQDWFDDNHQSVRNLINHEQNAFQYCQCDLALSTKRRSIKASKLKCRGKPVAGRMLRW